MIRSHASQSVWSWSGFLLRTFSLAVLVMILAACNNSNNQTTKPTQSAPGPTIPCTSHSSDPVTLSMYYGSEKQAWIDDVVASFNSRNIAACDGPITVKATPIGSGQSMQQ